MAGVHIEKNGDLAVLRLDKARGNAIDEPLVEEMIGAVRDLEKDDLVRGVLLASAHPRLFCPGLDLVALFEYDRPAMERFLARLLAMIRALFAFGKPVVAALSGHAVAGGCVVALTADYRLLRRGAQIGLNEVRVGLPLPWPVAVLMASAVPAAAWSRVALLGQNFTDDEAVALGLVHEVRDADGFEEASLLRLRDFADKDPTALATTKRYLRAAAIREMDAHDASLRAEFLDAWFSPAGRAKIQETIASLRGKG